MESTRLLVEEALIFGLLMGSATALVVVVGLSRWHWFLRFATPLVAAWILIPTGAYPASLFFLLTSWQILACVAAAQWWRSQRGLVDTRTRSLSFSLADLLLVIGLISAACGVGVFAFRQDDRAMVSILLSSVATSLIVLTVTWAAVTASLASIAAVCAALIMATAAWRFAWWFDPSGLRRPGPYSVVAPSATTACDALFGALGALCVAVLVVACSVNHQKRRWALQTARVFAILLLGVTTTVGGFIYYRLVRKLPIPATDLPNPNGWNAFVRAGEKLQGLVPDPDVDSRAALAQFLTENQEVFSSVREGLESPSLMPLAWETQDPDVRFIGRMGAVALGFRCEALVRADAGDFAGAAQSCVDCIQLARECSRGGLPTHQFVTESIELVGSEGLVRLLRGLDASTCRTAIEQLVYVDARRESAAEIVERGQLWTERNSNWEYRAGLAAGAMLLRPSTHARLEQDEQRSDALRRLLIIALALRAFELDQGAPSRSIEDLVPEYLARIPLDPYDGRPLRFKLAGERCTPYSIGPDLDDDGGLRLSWRELVTGRDGDLLLDVTTDKELVTYTKYLGRIR